MEFKDYYKIMGVARTATPDEIKRAYRQLARKYHPDVSKEADAETRFKEVGEAYEVLKDPEKRVAYDRLGANWKTGQDFHPPPDWNEGFEFSGGGFTGGNAADYSDFFEQLFGRAGPSRGHTGGHAGSAAFHARGSDRQARVLIDIEDAYRGGTRTITLRHPEMDAQGQVMLREQTLNVVIPRGVRSGQHIRLVGQGAPGMGQGKAGDLYLEVEFRSHPLYRALQHDVFLDLPVAPWEAALGATVKAPTPNGAVEIKIPAGSASGSKLRLKGRGIPAATPGDFYVVLQIALPPAADETTREVYKQMAEQFKAFNPRAGLGV